MKAAVVHTLGQPPRFTDFDDPSAGEGESIVRVAFAATSRLVRSRVEGAHYSSGGRVPFVAGVDGVGRTSDGRSVYFQVLRPPFGSMAERAAVTTALTVPIPPGLDDATAAAAAIAGMSCWVPLTRLAPIRPGESVLVNGATGVSGLMAVQVAKHLGARRVVATGRSPEKFARLTALGADAVIPIGASLDPLREAIRREARESNVGVVLDYLWGPTAEAILGALGGPQAPRGPERIRYVEVGGLGGPTVSLDGALLRSSGVELLGSGIGSSSLAALAAGIGEFLQAMARAQFAVDFDVYPLSEVERRWPLEKDRRQVYRLD